MAEKRWQTVKRRYCDHAGCEVSLQVQIILPATFMPEQPARVVAHRCSQGMQCATFTKPTCVWAGTNPDYDPFAEPE